MAATTEDEEIQRLMGRVAEAYSSKTGEPLSDALVAFIIRAVVLEHPSVFNLTKTLSEVDIQHLVKLSVARLLEKDSPSLATIKLQVAFDEAYLAEQQALETDAQTRSTKSQVLLEDIVATKPRGAAASEALYRKVLTFVMMAARIDQADTAATRATSAALESVLPRSEIGSLAALPNKQKTTQLQELANIVCGILLFNMATSRGGAFLDDAATAARSLSEDLQSSLSEEARTVSSDISDLTLVLNHSFVTGRPPPLGQERLQAELTLRRQYEQFVGVLSSDAAAVAARAAQSLMLYDAEIASLGEALIGTSSVPASAVYPRFVTLATLWKSLLLDAMILRGRHSMLHVLMSHRPTSELVPAETIQAAAAALGASRDMPVEASAAAAVPLSSSADAPELVDPSVPNFSQLPLEFDGFCATTIVKRQRLLLRGDRQLGLVRYHGKHYVFASVEALQEFMGSPQKMIEGVMNAARRAPELINLLNLTALFGTVPRLDHFEPQRDEQADGATSGAVDADTQTPTHFVEKHIDKAYEFSEWALRRRALSMANLRDKRTHSSQTAKSHFRRENETQTWLPKEGATQTAVDTGTNPIRRKNYVTGLRGHPEQKLKVVQLKLDL